MRAHAAPEAAAALRTAATTAALRTAATTAALRTAATATSLLTAAAPAPAALGVGQGFRDQEPEGRQQEDRRSGTHDDSLLGSGSR